MDCRLRLSFITGLIVSLGGCSQSLPVVSPSSPVQSKPADEDIKHKAPTYAAFAEMQMKSAESPQNAETQKQQFRERAKLAYLKALEVDPRYLPAYVGLAQVQMAAQDHAGAVAVYRKALELGPREAQLWFELGICQCRTRDWQAALASFGKAIELDPSNPQYAKTAGLTLARAGQWDDAYVMLARVEGEAKAHYNLARMLKHTNQIDLARRHASAALVVDPGFEPAKAFLVELGQPNAQAAVAKQAAAPKPTPPARTSVPATPVAESEMPQLLTPAAHTVASPQQIVPTSGVLPDQTVLPQGTTDKPVRMPPLPVIKLPKSGAR